MNESHEGYAHSPTLTWGSLLSATYRLYKERFWELFRIGLPVAILVYLFRPFEHAFVHLLFNWIASTSAGPEWVGNRYLYIPIGIFLGFIEGAFYWLTSTVFFAAVAARIIGEQHDMPLADAYTPVRPRIKPLLIAGLITWTLFFIGRGVSNSIMLMALSNFKNRPGFYVSVLMFSVPLLIIAGLLSRLALAVPELMDNSAISVREAIRSSIRKTENWEPFFMFFLAKSAIAGYAVYWLAERGFEQLWQRTSINETAYYWVTWAVYVCLFAILESPLFIAFSILHRDLEIRPEDAFSAPAIG